MSGVDPIGISIVLFLVAPWVAWFLIFYLSGPDYTYHKAKVKILVILLYRKVKRRFIKNEANKLFHS